jgi:VanZ family protein
MQKNIAIVLFVFVILFMCMITLGVFSHIKEWVYANHVNDKITHIFFASILTLLANFILQPRRIRIFSHEFLLGTLIMLFLFTLDETSQIFLPGREADPLDLAASYTGLLIGTGLFNLWVKRPHGKHRRDSSRSDVHLTAR